MGLIAAGPVSTCPGGSLSSPVSTGYRATTSTGAVITPSKSRTPTVFEIIVHEEFVGSKVVICEAGRASCHGRLPRALAGLNLWADKKPSDVVSCQYRLPSSWSLKDDSVT